MTYLLRPEAKPEILRNDFAGSTPAEIADQLEALHRRQALWGYHVVAAYPPEEEKLWHPQSGKRIEEVQRRVGIDKGLWIKHRGHWHGFLMSMRPNGGTIRLGTYEDGQPVPVAMAFRQMAERWEDETPGCQKTGRGARGFGLSRESLAMAEREYVAKKNPTPIPKKLLLKAEIDRLVALSRSFEELNAAALEAQVSIAYRRDATGKVLGLSFSKDGVSLRGREAGYSYTTLQKLYGNPTNSPTTDLRNTPRLAERTIGNDRRPSRGTTSPRNGAPDQNLGIHSRIADPARRPEPSRVAWHEAAIRALSPRKVTFVNVLLELSMSLTRVVRQNDYRRRFRRHEPPSL